MKKQLAQPGSVSHGTMRIEDLIPRFLMFLAEHGINVEMDPGEVAVINKMRKGRPLTEDEDYLLSEILNEQLFDAMQELSPEGHYFGSHPGDGSDYGFWPEEMENPSKPEGALPRRSRSSSEAKAWLCDKLSAMTVYQSKSSGVADAINDMNRRFNLTLREREYLHGMADAITDGWYRTNLVFAVEYPKGSGQMYKQDWNSLPEEVREHLRNESTRGKLKQGYYWLNRDGTIGKEYFASAE